jgi:CRP/FNR family transcriptional regulator/CRP/FNR family cyclic AMP-dependent transcriptional regulator
MDTHLFQNIPLFKDLSEQEVAMLARHAVPRQFSPEQIILLAEEEGDTMCVIQHGKVKVSVITDEGREIILDILGDGDFFGEMALLDGYPRSATVTAMEATTLVMLRRSDFLQLLRSEPQVASKLLVELTTRLRRADRKIETLALVNSTSKVLKILMEFGERYGTPTSDGIIFHHPPTQQELGNMVGISRETTSRLLNHLKRKGTIAYNEDMLVIYYHSAQGRPIR